MKTMARRLALLLAGVTALLCCACSKQPEDGFHFNIEETSESGETDSLPDEEFETIVPLDDNEADKIADSYSDDLVPDNDLVANASEYSFRSAVWLAKDISSDTERYFLFYDDHNGKVVDQQTGMGVGFTCELTDTEGVFHFGGPDDQSKASIYWTDANELAVKWADGKSELFTFLRDNGAVDLQFYSSDQLCALALDYYQAKNNYRPAMADALINLDETIAIHLYDVQDDHISTCDWYTVDRYTAQGYNVLEEPVALVGGAVEETAPAESTEVPTEAPTDVPTDVPTEGVPVA